MYYNYNKLWAYDALFNFVIAERGVGKSYGAKKSVVKDFLKNGHEFVYLRRYGNELDMSAPRLFKDIEHNGEFPDYDFKTRKSHEQYLFEIYPKTDEDGEVLGQEIENPVMGYGIPLSTAAILKSSTFDKVRTIIFDEFLIDNTGRRNYLKNEVEQLLDVVETVARSRDIRVLFLGNALQISNPYFNYFNLHLPYKKEFETFKNGLIVVNYAKNIEFREMKKKTKFGQLIEGTDYGKYAIDNDFLLDNHNFIEKKSQKANFYFNIHIENKKFGIWKDIYTGKVFVTSKIIPDSPYNYTLAPENHTESNIYMTKRDPHFRIIHNAYLNSLLRFENDQIKSYWLKTLKYFL